MATLIRAPPRDESVSHIESNMELRSLSDIDPDLFTNKRALWHPPGARGIYGGAVIAQCLSAAQRTVPDDFLVHSMHCYFVLAGNSGMPVIYHVEHVREGKSFATRTVQARQRGKVIFTVTLSFTKEGSAGKKTVNHNVALPDVPMPLEDESEALLVAHGPFESQHLDNSYFSTANSPSDMRSRCWLRARGNISKAGGHQAHLVALAYMSDSFFIGTVARAHKLYRHIPTQKPGRKETESDTKFKDAIKRTQNPKEEDDGPRDHLGMMVSLDHTIYFHRPKDFRADDWLFSEMETPWAGDGRGLVLQRIWSKDGQLIATCVQEGLVRLVQDTEDSKL